MLAHFHEITLATHDIRASVEFYERLGFSQAVTGDAWPHPYGVITDGRIFLGLHELPPRSPAITFVHPGVAEYATELEARGLTLSERRTDPEEFNQISLEDPSGQLLRFIEARTYSPVGRDPADSSLCGRFAHFGLPVRDFAAASGFWEPLGFVATEETAEPYPHLPLTSDSLDLAFHSPRLLDVPALVFAEQDMSARIERLREQGLEPAPELPRGLERAGSALLLAPEGTALLLVQGTL
jgi:catechol 2,3-dioxygenase-like lactoylglutathione lyase family enzyme